MREHKGNVRVDELVFEIAHFNKASGITATHVSRTDLDSSSGQPSGHHLHIAKINDEFNSEQLVAQSSPTDFLNSACIEATR